MNALHVWTNSYEWWVARDMEHLAELYREACGLELDDDDAEGDGWRQVDDAGSVTLHLNDSCADSPDVDCCPRKTWAEWADQEGAGYLGGIEQ